MLAGNLDRRITIQAATETRDSQGGVVKVWATVAELWAERRDVRGREYFSARQEVAENMATFRIRWRTGITEKMRVLSDGKTYDIEAIAPIGRNEGLDLMAVAVVP